MDIQTLLYILIGIGVFGFRIWNEFQKQKTENQKRTFQKPAPHVERGEMEKRPPARRDFSFEELLENLADDQVLPADRYERQVVEEKVEQKNPEPISTAKYKEPLYEKPVVQKPLEEVRVAEELKSTAIHSKHHHELQMREEEEVQEFDGRDAVLKSIILQRPDW